MARKICESEQRLARRYSEDPVDVVETELRRRPPQKAVEAIARFRFDKDYNRLLYASSFRKLGGITQVVTAGETATFHNRLTHSLKVAQTAGLIEGTLRRLAASRAIGGRIEEYGGLNRSVLDAACLAHDLGHPPFGHTGEAAIQELLRQPAEFIPGFHGGTSDSDLCFEGNAQSFRIVTRLAIREAGSGDGPNPALNLTRAVLSAQSKYPWTSEDPLREQTNKWGAYRSEADLLAWALEGTRKRHVTFFGNERYEQRTIEAQVMDWADDVAYAVHDVEDFFRAGLVPLDAIAMQGREFNAFFDYAVESLSSKNLSRVMKTAQVRDLLDREVRGALPGAPYIGSESDRIVLHRFAKSVIGPATRNLDVDENGVLLPQPEMYVIVEVLKKLTWYYVIERPSLSSAQRGQRNILIDLIGKLWQWSYDYYRKLLGSDADDAPSSPTKGVTRERSYRDLPPRLVDYIEIARLSQLNIGTATLQDMILRGVVDYVVSLTDGQAAVLHARLTGVGAQSMLDPLVSF